MGIWDLVLRQLFQRMNREKVNSAGTVLPSIMKQFSNLYIHSPYQIINLVVPATWNKYYFTCLLNNFKRLAGFVRLWEEAFVPELCCCDIVGQVAMGVF